MPRPMIDLAEPLRRRLSQRLVRAARNRERRGDNDMSVGELIETLGDRSFGWCFVLFSLINMLPMPIGSNMITSIPVILIAGQMALGLKRVWLPGFVKRMRIGRRRFQKQVLWLGPVIRPIERVVRERHTWIFTGRAERGLGIFLFLVTLALFAPIPLSGYIPAAALFLAGIGLVERDGLVTLGGVFLGAIAIAVTLVVGAMLVLGAERLAH